MIWPKIVECEIGRFGNTSKSSRATIIIIIAIIVVVAVVLLVAVVGFCLSYTTYLMYDLCMYIISSTFSYMVPPINTDWLPGGNGRNRSPVWTGVGAGSWKSPGNAVGWRIHWICEMILARTKREESGKIPQLLPTGDELRFVVFSCPRRCRSSSSSSSYFKRLPKEGLNRTFYCWCGMPGWWSIHEGRKWDPLNSFIVCASIDSKLPNPAHERRKGSGFFQIRSRQARNPSNNWRSRLERSCKKFTRHGLKHYRGKKAFIILLKVSTSGDGLNCKLVWLNNISEVVLNDCITIFIHDIR